MDDPILALDHLSVIHGFYIRAVVNWFGYEKAKEVATLAEKYTEEVLRAERQ